MRRESLNNRKVKGILAKLHQLKASVLSKKMNNMISKTKSKNETRKLNNKLNHLFRMKNEWSNSHTLKNRVQARKLKSPNKTFGRKMSFSERLGIRPVVSPVMEPLYDPLENIDRLPDSPVGNMLYDPRLSRIPTEVPTPVPILRRPVIRRPVIKKRGYNPKVFNSTVINNRFIP